MRRYSRCTVVWTLYLDEGTVYAGNTFMKAIPLPSSPQACGEVTPIHNFSRTLDFIQTRVHKAGMEYNAAFLQSENITTNH